jgi:hypothetical protein
MLCSFQALTLLDYYKIVYDMLRSFQALTLDTRLLQNGLRYALQFSSINASY